MTNLFSIAAVVLILSPVVALGSEESVWKGLFFDKTTLEEAVASIGPPREKRKEKIKTQPTVGGKVTGTLEIQILEYKNADGWEKVSLAFLNNKLFKAKFWAKNKTVRAYDLTATYQADFLFVEGFAKGVPLSVFEGQKEPSVPRVYPTVYYMVSAKPDRYIFATINNGSFGALWKDAMKKATVQMFPGFVEDIEIISRAGEPK